MATRFYLPYTASAPPNAPDIDTEWRAFDRDRAITSNVPVANTLTSLTWSGGDSGNGTSGYNPDGRWHTYVCYKQFISPPLAAQTIPANTPWTLQCQIDKLTAGAGSAGTNNDLHYLMFRGSLIAPADTGAGVYSFWGGEATNPASGGSQVMQNRTISGVSGIARTILNGSLIVLEIGVHSSYPSQPYAIAQHSLRFGYNAAGWLPSADNTDIITKLSPWWELNHNLLFPRQMTAAAGAFTLGRQPTGFLGPKKLAGNPGTFGLSGKDISLARTRALAVDPLPYVLSGQDAAFASGQTMTADAGSFAVLGQDADFQKTRLITSDPGSFVVGGKSAGLTRGDTSALDAAEFTVSGQDAAFVFAPGTTFGAGVFAVSGQDAMLTYSSAPPSTSIGTGGDTLAWLLIDKPGGNW